MENIIMKGVREYAEKYDVKIVEEIPDEYNGLKEKRLVIRALNEGGHNCTIVDLKDVITWVKKNMPKECI